MKIVQNLAYRTRNNSYFFRFLIFWVFWALWGPRILKNEIFQISACRKTLKPKKSKIWKKKNCSWSYKLGFGQFLWEMGKLVKRNKIHCDFFRFFHFFHNIPYSRHRICKYSNCDKKSTVRNWEVVKPILESSWWVL